MEVVTLAQIIGNHPDLFYRQQWFLGEAFMYVDAEQVSHMPQFWPAEPNSVKKLPSAATLALLYVKHPNDPLWNNYLWTSDKDHRGQRVYMGCNGQGMEIHRHIHLTERFGVAVWH